MKSLAITGGTGALGRAVLARLGRDYRCVVLYHTSKPANVEGIADASQFEGPLFAILHLAGGFTTGSSADDFVNMLEMNVMSAVRPIEALRNRIEDGGRIVAISSIASLTTPPELAAYAAAKAALNAYIQVLAKELQPRRITANALLPSTLGPTGVPYERVAETIAFFLSDAAASISGQLLTLTS